MTDLVIRSGSPESFGWQRRPEHDTATGRCYETPDGKLELHSKDMGEPIINQATWRAPRNAKES